MSAVSRHPSRVLQCWYRFRGTALSAALASVLVISSTSDARAELGWGLGPVFAFTANDSPSLGWELSVIGDDPLGARAALGGNYSWSVHDDDPARIHYLVWEPWAYLGATVGLAMADLQPRLTYGLWEGIGMSLDSNVYESDERQWVVSLAIGWRGLGGTHQFYLTPKLWRMNGWRFNS